MINTAFNNTVFNSFTSVAPISGAIEKTFDLKLDKSKKLKVSALAGSVISTSLSAAFIIKSNKSQKSLLKKALTSNFASTKNLIIVGISSIIGGFIGGVAEDKKKNIWQKIKEMNFQVLSNVAFPLVFLNIFKKIGANLAKNSTKTVKNIVNFASVFGGVGAGAYVGSSIADKINKQIIKPEIDYQRKLGAKDFLVHIDDLPVALALTNIPFIDKLIPFVLVSRGHEVGKQ